MYKMPIRLYDLIVNTIADSFLLKTAIAAIGGVFGALIEGNERIVVLIVVVYLIDLITGVCKAIQRKTFTSSRFYHGAMKLAVYSVMALLGFGLDYVFFTGSVFTSFFLGYAFVTDAISILENLDQLGFDVPVSIVRILRVRKERLQEQFLNRLSDRDVALIREFQDKEFEMKPFQKHCKK